MLVDDFLGTPIRIMAQKIQSLLSLNVGDFIGSGFNFGHFGDL